MTKSVFSMLRWLSLAAVAVTVGNASTMVYYANIFYPSASGSVLSGTPLSGAQLQTAAADPSVQLYCTGGFGCAQASGFSTNVWLPKFNQTIAGDANHAYFLDNVQLALGWVANGTVDVSNTNTSPESYTAATSTVPITITGPAGLTFLTNATAGPYAGTVPGATTTFRNLDLTGIAAGLQVPICNTALGGTLSGNTCRYPTGTAPGTVEVGGVIKTFGSGASAVLTSGLENYQGAGVSSLNFSVDAGRGMYSGASVAGVSFGGSAVAGGVIEIVYNYHTEAVPEPMPMAMVGGALIVLAAWVRRKKLA
jgi:hypothetical protein